MGLVRLITFALLAWIVWFMVRNYLVKQRREKAARPGKETQGADASAQRIVKCRYCDVHLPQGDAVRIDDAWFCNGSHRQAWLESQSNGRS